MLYCGPVSIYAPFDFRSLNQTDKIHTTESELTRQELDKPFTNSSMLESRKRIKCCHSFTALSIWCLSAFELEISTREQLYSSAAGQETDHSHSVESVLHRSALCMPEITNCDPRLRGCMETIGYDALGLFEWAPHLDTRSDLGNYLSSLGLSSLVRPSRHSKDQEYRQASAIQKRGVISHIIHNAYNF